RDPSLTVESRSRESRSSLSVSTTFARSSISAADIAPGTGTTSAGSGGSGTTRDSFFRSSGSTGKSPLISRCFFIELLRRVRPPKNALVEPHLLKGAGRRNGFRHREAARSLSAALVDGR